MRNSTRRLETDDLLTPAAERFWLLVVLVVAVLPRTLWYAAPDEPHGWFAETVVLWAQRFLDEDDLWRRWLGLLKITQVSWVHESAVMMPVAMAFQVLLGPSLHLATLIGAAWNVVAVVLAWRLGRAVRSPMFGLLFAALVAGSPLQIAWSRLGGIHIGAVTHVLLVLWLGYAAGSRGSVVLALATVVAGWATLYHYYGARVALPLALIAFVAGLATSRTGRGPRLRALVALLVGTGLLLFYASRSGIWATFWPHYTGYLGSQGEQTARELVHGAILASAREFPKATRAYFWASRAGGGGDALTPSLSAGGLCLLPVSALGMLGLVVALWRWRRDALWLALAGLGFLIPLLSLTAARRFLVFDVGWAALAATAMASLVDSRLLSRLRPQVRVSTAMVVVLFIAAQGGATLLALNARLPLTYWASIPFGEGGGGDGLTCRGCAQRARAWQDEIARGAFVILVESDLEREWSTIPGGVLLYGRIGALAAGRPANFLEYYPLAANFDLEPPRVGPIYNPLQTDFAEYIARRLEAAQPSRILWEFPEPTQWERWLAQRLVAAGGQVREVDEPSLIPGGRPGADTGLVVATPWERRESALAVLRELARRGDDRATCVELVRTSENAIPHPPLVLAARPGGPDGAPPRWAIGSGTEIRAGDQDIPTGDPVAIASGSPGEAELAALRRDRTYVAVDAARGARVEGRVPGSTPIGQDCAARFGGSWWVVDPISGTLVTTAPAPAVVPRGPWVGIARDAAGHALLGAADQTIHVVDPATGAELRRFPAQVPPSRRVSFAECTLIVAGDGWAGTVDHLRSSLSIYSEDGKALGVARLDRPPLLGDGKVLSAVGTGPYLALGTSDQRVVTLELRIAPECAAAQRGAAADEAL